MFCYLEGGPRGQRDIENIRACQISAQKCVDLGFQFCQVDGWNGTIKFMHFKVKWASTVQK
eukprot:9503455-Pyramimonas_sp.AAC.1